VDQLNVGESNTARAFDANIHLELPDRGLYLVVGRGRSPVTLIKTCGGQSLVRIPDSFTVLAMLPVQTFLAFQKHRDIALVGPVSIDPVRFAQFAQAAGLDPDGDGQIG